ncbi:SWIM zinc finger family protein [Micromonospora sp. BRA006-A]|nr:SWIM zinc finger family protein [Micromonospora sp. BRA006-A]
MGSDRRRRRAGRRRRAARRAGACRARPAGHRRAGRVRRGGRGVLPPGDALRRGPRGADNPRLVGARALVERGAVERDGENATVRTDAETYRVRRHPDGAYSCSCRWWARHRGQQGPCRHALAVSMVAAPVGALS